MLKGGYSAGIWLLLEDKPCVSLPVSRDGFRLLRESAARGLGDSPGYWKVIEKLQKKWCVFKGNLNTMRKLGVGVVEIDPSSHKYQKLKL